jgi:asparagine synthase (glutamine-hydrolysing)
MRKNNNMSGIGCFIGKRDGIEYDIEDKLKVINDIQLHRGPDSQGYYIDRSVGLCNTRLSIIDLSEKAGQPFFSDDKNYVIVYNGEVYNFKDIRAELEINGIRFSTESDTEVVLKSYIFWGTECFKKFNGVFAFIVHDTVEKKVFVVRDRAGIKNVHFYSDDDCIIIASEVKAILGLLKEYAFRSESLYDILLVGHIEGTKTGFEKVFALEPGTFAEIDLNVCSVSIKNYCIIKNEIKPLVYRENANIPLDRAVEYLDALIHQSVKMHLIGDAPIGSLCSGGIDSSLITTIAMRYNPDITMYHAGAEEEGSWSEEKYAKLVADRLNTDIHYIKVNKKIFFDNLVDTIYHLDLPGFYGSDVSMYQICSLAHTHGVKVLLAGDGADALFGDPMQRKFLNQLQRRRSFNNRIFNAIKMKFLTNLEYSHNDNYYFLKGILLAYHSDLEKTYPLLLNKGENIVRWDQIYRAFQFLENKDERLMNTLLMDNIHGHLGSILYRTDRMGMMASVEIRVPFLENNILNYAFNLPLKYKIAHNESKFILKKVAEKYLPKEIIYRGKKSFSTPSIRNIEYNEDLFEHGFVEDFFSVPRDILHHFIKKDKELSYRLLAIEIWGRIFIYKENRESIKRLVH